MQSIIQEQTLQKSKDQLMCKQLDEEMAQQTNKLEKLRVKHKQAVNSSRDLQKAVDQNICQIREQVDNEGAEYLHLIELFDSQDYEVLR